MDDFERELAQFELELDDPSVTELIKKAQFTNEYLAVSPMTGQEAELAMTELNTVWKTAGLKNEKMHVSGDAWASLAKYGVDYDKQFNPDTYTRFINQKCRVGGFTLLSNTQLDEEGIHSTQEIYLNVRTLIDDDEGIANKTPVDFLVSLEDATYIHYEGISPKRAENWLDFHYPDEKSQIIQACIETEDEAEAVLGLRYFNVPIEGLDKQTIRELKRNLEVYTEDVLNLETHIPYTFQVCGTIKTLSSSEESNGGYIDVEAFTPDQAFIHIQNILYEKTGNRQALEPLLYGSYVSSDGKDLTMCKIPFTELYNLESLRTLVKQRNKESRDLSA